VEGLDGVEVGVVDWGVLKEGVDPPASSSTGSGVPTAEADPLFFILTLSFVSCCILASYSRTSSIVNPKTTYTKNFQTLQKNSFKI
jgi:hypothetical protein